MSRDSVASVTSAASLPQLKYQLLCHVNSLSSGPVRACTGGRFIVAGTTTYTPVGGFGGLSDQITEDQDPFPRATRLWFAAINTGSLLTEVVNETIFNKPVKLYRCFLDDTLAVVGTPQLLTSLRGNKVNLKTNDAQRGNYFEIECESRLRRTPRAQFNDKTTLWQVLSSSGDTFFDYTYMIQTTRASWGQLPSAALPGYSPYDLISNPWNPNPLKPPGYISI